MASSVDLLAKLHFIESGVKAGTNTLFDARATLNAYLQAFASEKGAVLPNPLPDVTPYTLALSKFAAGNAPYADVEAARTQYVLTVSKASKAPLTLSRIGVVKSRLDAAIAAKAPQATIDALKAEYAKMLGQQTTTAQKNLDTAVAANAPTNVIKDLQTRLTTAKSQEASGALATNPMKEVFTFALLTSPAWLPLLLIRLKVI